MARHYWWEDTVTVHADVDDIINQIPTEELELELEKRHSLKKTDENEFKNEEKYRTNTIDFEMAPDDYDLVDKDVITLTEYFSDCDMISHLEDVGFAVVSKDETFGNIENVAAYLYSLQNYKFKSFMCDALGLSQVATKEEIINEFKNRL